MTQARPAGHRLLAEGLAAPEGPVLGPNGWILNVCSLDRVDADLPTKGGDITATNWNDPGRPIVVFNTSTERTTGIPAALAFGPDHCLYVTDEGRRSVVRVTADGELTDIVTHYGDTQLNGPNDLCFDSAGNLFFSDPWTSSLENPIGGIYGLAWETRELHQIATGMAFPNGVAIRDDILYVAETLTQTVWSFELLGDGRAANRKPFCRLPLVEYDGWQGPDGMAFSEDGRLYVANIGSSCIRVFDRAGELAESIPTSGVIPTNVCFVGPRRDALAVTIDDRDELILFDLDVVGQPLQFCPTTVADHAWSGSRLFPPVAS